MALGLVFQPVPGQTAPQPLFVIHADSIQQARQIAAAKVAGEVIIVAVTRDGAAK